MKLLFTILCLHLLFSCSSIKWKKKEPKKDNENITSSTIKNIPFAKPENWADEYYQKTYFVVKSPRILETFNELSKVCKSRDFEFTTDYQANRAHPIKYKKMPITIMSNKGFSKKTFISKGACRELSLFKTPKKSNNSHFRKRIKSITLMYIYNKGTYLKDLVFDTQFSDVQFLVE